ncbi:MAG: aspartate kinase [Bacteroidales bacterium]|nr:aspartate kinase [Bacteroidales bacterium]HQK36500.1 aspartate kinase [Bacteroidales bacterium]
MLTVEKIGGTSMSKFGDVLKNIILRNRPAEDFYNRIFVVSAYNNVTNWLLEHKKTGDPGIYSIFVSGGDYRTALKDLLKKLLDINKGFSDIGLDLLVAEEFITGRIRQAENYLQSLSEVMASGYVVRENILHAAREILASIGEAHSAFNSVNILEHHGINASFIDLCGFNDPEPLTIDERIRKMFSGIDFSKTLCIATGYTKGTEGIMREFDRGYSEITFSKIAVVVKASEAIIHKEYHLSSADPVIVGVENSRPVGFTNYNVADQLADVGMEAIHPKASKPLEVANINLRIKNTFEPDHPGTLISKNYKNPEPKVEIITGTDKVLVIEIQEPLMVGQVGFDLGIMQVFQKHKVSYILKATNANSISMVVWDNQQSAGLINELQSIYDTVAVKQASIVCAIGSNITGPGIVARAASAIAQENINIDCLSLSLSQVNIQFVVGREDFRKTIIALNKELCLS